MKERGAVSKRVAEMMKKAMTLDPADALRALEEIKGKLDNVERFGRRVDKGFNSMATSIGLVGDMGSSTVGSLIEGFADFTSDLSMMPEKLNMIKKGLQQMIDPVRLLASGFEILKQSFNEMEGGAIEMARVNMETRAESFASLNADRENLRRMNIGLLDQGKAYASATYSIHGFNKLTGKSRHHIGGQILQIEKLGVNMKTAESLINKLAISSGRNIPKATKAVVALSVAATHAGIAPDKMVSGFESALPALSAGTEQAAKQFTNLAIEAKQAGVEVTDLLNIAKKFDTFKESADFVAYLNGTIGTSLSSIELMSMEMDERAEAVRGAIQSTVGDFDALDRATKLMIAQQIAGGDLQKARGMLAASGSAEAREYEEAQKKIEDYNGAIEKIQNVLPTLVDTFTQVKNEIMAFLEEGEAGNTVLDKMQYAATALVDAVRFLIENFEAISKALVAYKTISLTIMTIERRKAYLMTLSSSATKKGTRATIGYGKMSAGAVPGVTGLAGGTRALGMSIMFALGPLVQIIMMGWLLYEMFHATGSPALWAIAGVMAIGIIALGVAFYFAGPAIWPVVAALAAMFGAIALIFHALPPLVDSIGGLMDKVIESPMALYNMAGGLTAVGFAFVFLGKMALIGAGGIAMGALALVALRTSMALSGTTFEELGSIGSGILSIGEGISKFGAGIRDLASGASALIGGIGDKSLAASVRSDGTSLVAGSDAIFGSFMGMDRKITVDVNMPEMENQRVDVNVYLDGSLIRENVHKTINGASE